MTYKEFKKINIILLEKSTAFQLVVQLGSVTRLVLTLVMRPSYAHDRNDKTNSNIESHDKHGKCHRILK